MADSYFRGFHAIGEVAKRIAQLAEFQLTHKPDVKTLRLKRRDFDLVKKWPKAAAMHGFERAGDAILYRGLKLVHDRSRPRYPPFGAWESTRPQDR